MLIEYLKGLGITRFTAGTALKNLPSVRLLKSLGFRQIGEDRYRSIKTKMERISFLMEAFLN